MAVRIRLKRIGRKNRPFYRVDVFDGRKKRDGISIENIGYYDPHIADNDAKITLKEDRVKYWLARGAQPSTSVEKFLLAKGILEPAKGRDKLTPKEREKRKKRRRGMKRCTSKRRIKNQAKKAKAASRPKTEPAPAKEAEQPKE